MPFKRRNYGTRKRTSSSYRKRRTYSRMYRKKRRYAKVSRVRLGWKNPLPEIAKYRFVYNDNNFEETTAVGAGWINSHMFRGNSIYDPDLTGVGVQPYGYDQLLGATSPFQAYRVFASKITIYPTIRADGTYPATVLRGIVFPFRDTSAPSYFDPSDLSRLPWHKTLVLRSADNNGANKFSCYCSTKNIVPDTLEDTTFQGGYSSNPGTQWTWQIYWDTVTQSAAGRVTYDVKITYYVKLFKRDTVNES